MCVCAFSYICTSMSVELSNDEVSICNAMFFVVLHTFEFTYLKYPYLNLSLCSGLGVHFCVCSFSIFFSVCYYSQTVKLLYVMPCFFVV